MRSSLIRLLSIVAVVFGLVNLLPRVAQAHATLVSCNGLKRGATLHALPKVLTCTFAEGVNPKDSFVRIVQATGDGAEVDRENSAVSFTNAHQITVGVPKLAKGAYLLMWFTVSADDGHRAGGVLPFTIN